MEVRWPPPPTPRCRPQFPFLAQPWAKTIKLPPGEGVEQRSMGAQQQTGDKQALLMRQVPSAAWQPGIRASSSELESGPREGNRCPGSHSREEVEPVGLIYCRAQLAAGTPTASPVPCSPSDCNQVLSFQTSCEDGMRDCL